MLVLMIKYKAGITQLQVCSQEKNGNSLNQTILKSNSFQSHKIRCISGCHFSPWSFCFTSIPCGLTPTVHCLILVPLLIYLGCH